MQIKDIVLKILIIGIEDVSALYEILWDFSDEKSTIDIKVRVSKVTEKLLQFGLIKLYWCQEPYGELTEIHSPQEAIELLTQEKYWNIPEQDSLWLRFETTKAGEDVYKQIYQGEDNSFIKKIEGLTD